MESNKLNWGQFKQTLLQHPALDLQFQYSQTDKVSASYHITEIKQAPITSVDCGGITNKWTEIIVQLYEPAGGSQLRPMKVRKALSIIDVVEKALPLDPSGIVKIEFGNAAFDTRQMYPGEFMFDNEELVVDLRPDTVQCKAIERGGTCGTPASTKPKLELKNLTASEACCTPGGGCC